MGKYWRISARRPHPIYKQILKFIVDKHQNTSLGLNPVKGLGCENKGLDCETPPFRSSPKYEVAESIRENLSCQLIIMAALAALAFMGVGCGQSDFQKHLSKLETDTMAQRKAAEIQAALRSFIIDEHSSTNRLPKEITSLPIFEDDPTNIVVSRADCANALMLCIGGGFGHRGLFVVRPGHDSEICDWHRARAKYWDGGVYFFSE